MIQWLRNIFSPQPVFAMLDGVQYRVVKTHGALAKALDEEKRALYQFRCSSYTLVVRSLVEYLKGRYGEDSREASAVIPASVICSKCKTLFPDAWKMAIAMQGVADLPGSGQGSTCPSCGCDDGLLQLIVHAKEDITEADVEALRRYWRESAKEWWSNQSEDATDCWNSSGCGPIPRDEGYLLGTNEVRCEKCANRKLEDALENLRENPAYFGMGMLEKISKYRPDT